MNKLVSIVTPCYNGEKFVFRLLDSVLEQTYPNIEFIFVDDGSTDKTKNILETYIDRFKDRGFNLIYIYQENQGQAAAINQGLKCFEGEYFTWIDSDDFYLAKDAIEIMVKTLSATSSDTSFVHCQGVQIDENTLQPLTVLKLDKEHISLFEDCILEHNFKFMCGSYLVKSDILKSVLKDNSIFETRAGQNWQMLLPLLYRHKCIFVDKPLVNYLVRSSSHSRSIGNTFSEQLKRIDSLEEVLMETILRIKNIKEEEKQRLLMLIRHKYLKKRFIISVDSGNRTLSEDLFSQLKKGYPNQLTVMDNLYYLLRNNLQVLTYVRRIIRLFH